MGDDAELLALAIDTASVERKLACVQALGSEEGLNAAEREFRKRDRRVHSLAKQRREALVKQRETRVSAAELIRAATALLDATVIPANRLVELGQAWDILPGELIEDGDKSRFARLQADLTELVRERGERKRAASRWTAAANQALEEIKLACAGVAVSSFGSQELAAMLAAASGKARAALAETPAAPASGDVDSAPLGAAIQSALQDLALIEARLTIIGELQAGRVAQQETPDAETSGMPPSAELKAAASERWQALAPIADTHIGNALQARFDACLHHQDEARKQLKKQNGQLASEKSKAAKRANVEALTAAADATEAALAAGQLAEAGKQFAILQAASGKSGIGAALQARIGALQSEFSRLKGWQQWGGGRVRDDLVLEAEALAASTVSPEGSPPVKLQIKQLDNSIGQLRARWKELDRLGAATSKPLWQRFDAALKTANLPVAALQTQLKQARQENLAARRNLLAVLDALDVVAGEQHAPDWKEINRALLHFHAEWRKLGPVEHTVPHKAQSALLEHVKVSIARLEGPLREAQVGAQAEREQLIVRARALAQETQGRDMMAKLRELQTRWQNHARSQPLPRKLENKLWAEFKAATDALMAQREAAFSARDAELKTGQTAREALIAQLEALHQDTPPADIKRALASVETEWRNAGEAPRNQADKLESRYRAAREQAQQHIAGSALRAWQHTCDALLAKLALCEKLESAPATAAIEADWAALSPLPARWEQALQARRQSGGTHTGGEPLDSLLLELESALGIPSPAAFQGARQMLKLMAMKNAMEGRKPATPAWAEIENMTATALAFSLSAEQRDRFRAIVEALRKSGSRRSQV